MSVRRLSHAQVRAMEWLKAQPGAKCDRLAYRRAGITTGTLASLVVQGLVIQRRITDRAEWTWEAKP